MNQWQRVILCLLLGGVCAATGRPNYLPVDTKTYRDTARLMKQGEGYYPAVVRALQARPSQARSVRLPTSSWLLQVVPEKAWPELDALFWATALFIVSLMSRKPEWTIILGGLWLALLNRFGIALYSEIYGLPFAMWGLKEVREGRDANAALSFLAASCFRELYAVGLLVGLVLRRKWVWGAMTAALLFIYSAHVLAVRPYLVSGGYEQHFAQDGYGLHTILQAFSPATGVGYLFAAVVFVLGVRGLRREPFLALYVLLLVAASAFSLRYYWQVTYVLVLVAGLHHYRPARKMTRTANTANGRDEQLDPVTTLGAAVEG